MASAPLPREIIKWLQALDLSFSIKNPKRDFSNGYLVAEIMSRYHPQDVDINAYENGNRLEAKVDNWEQLYRFFKKKNIGITKAEFDPVIHCAPGAAVILIYRIYEILTKCTVRSNAPIKELQNIQHELPPFMRDTASRRLKDPEISRIQDNVERTIVAIDVLGSYHQERRAIKATEAPALIRQERRLRLGLSQEEMSHGQEQLESVMIDEVKVKALQSAQLKRNEAQRQETTPVIAKSSHLLKAVTEPQACCAALAKLQQTQVSCKPAMEIMRPLVFSILQESEEFSKMIDTKKEDMVVAFMEQCREGVRDAGRQSSEQVPLELRMREIEETSVRVFETLAKRAELLVDSLTKSPAEFWKVWTTFYPALVDFSESSPIFESALYFFKRLGELMRDADPQLTQQLMNDVALSSLSRELARSPEKREVLTEVIYSFTQEDALNRVMALRALKEKVGDNIPVYVACLASLVQLDGHKKLLDEHLMDLYIYYALVAIQSPQPRTRVAGLSILCSVTQFSGHEEVLSLLRSFAALCNDEWWEVQAQLLRLAARLLARLDASHDDGASGTEEPEQVENQVQDVLDIVGRLFVVSSSKNVLQVGLSGLVYVLQDYPMLLPNFVAVLLAQPSELRRRLLEEGGQRRQSYVQGNSTNMYEEACLPEVWPHLDIAKTLAQQIEAMQLLRIEEEHLEVLHASLPFFFEDEEADEWLHVFEKVKQHLFHALVDARLHVASGQIIKKFLACGADTLAQQSRETSRASFVEVLGKLYGQPEDYVEEASMLVFLRELRNFNEDLRAEVETLLDAFSEDFPDEYKASQLETALAD